ncbi:MAG: trypsin-like serine peptidase [Planctomycetota bacterium]|jgi:hypothetical protein
MKTKCLSLVALVAVCIATVTFAQETICIDGKCQAGQVQSTIVLDPLREELTLVDQEPRATANGLAGDRFDQVVRATVRVTVSGVCGSGTVVGRTPEGNAIVLTNAHVAGTTRGRTVNVERWNTNGTSEKGTGTIIASGYGRGTSVDFALLKCSAAFAKDVDPIPLADRYPSNQSSVTTFGCPRCEWPSLQVLRLNRKEGQILSWKPEAIGGRSGSSLIDYTDEGPRVVGLLTWAGGGEGLGQSTPFLLSAMRGKLPTTLEGLPSGTREVSCQVDDASDSQQIVQVPSTTLGEPLQWPMGLLAQTQVQDDVIDSIIDRPKLKPAPRDPEDSGIITDRIKERYMWSTTSIVATSAGSSIAIILGLQYGIPLVLGAIRNARKNRGKTLLDDEQFNQLMDQYSQLLKLMEQNGKTPPDIKS